MPNVGDSITAFKDLSNYFPAPISVYEYHADSIAPSGDVDTYQISLFTGQSNEYQFYVTGLSEVEGNGNLVFDPTLTLYDPNGNQVDYDDSTWGYGFDASINFKPDFEGLYTFAVAGQGTETGDYVIYTTFSVLG